MGGRHVASKWQDSIMVVENEYIDSCLRIYKQRIAYDVSRADQILGDFLSYLQQCNLVIRSQDHMNRQKDIAKEQ